MTRKGKDDPVATMGRREQREWRRRERGVVAAHHADLEAVLRGLVGAPVLDLRAGPAGTVTLAVPGWRVGVAGVSPSARAAVTSRAGQTCHVTGGGRYGRFWWLTIGTTADPKAAPAVVLGAYAAVHPADGGTRRATRREYSLS